MHPSIHPSSNIHTYIKKYTNHGGMQSQGSGPIMTCCNGLLQLLLPLPAERNSELRRRVRSKVMEMEVSVFTKETSNGNQLYKFIKIYVCICIYIYMYVKIICMFATQIVAGFHPSKRCCSLGVNDHKQVRNVWNQALRQQQQRIDVHVIYVSCCSSCPKGNGVTSKKK